MNHELHVRAERLIAQERIEEISATERAWLAKHLDECTRCAAMASSTQQALASLRASSVDLPRGLASRTQMRVRMRAEELRERAPGKKILWAITAVSWGLGVATAPWVWHGFEWLGQHTGVPKPFWEMGFVLWWAIPAIIAAGAVILEKKDEQQII
ncbi:MAG TPA: hypothetical protein VOA78_10795 [Candidatus Dormibacteraeota bacterium]|nr:hypothetical protein [Candidatus Dormibacteraeota bacterium]